MRICAGFVICLVFYGLAAACPVGANDIVGVASVIDGDTIEIHDQRIRLFGIDAPESQQPCLDSNGKQWRCGQKAALALAVKIGTRMVECEQRDVDRYRRIVAVCYLGNSDLGAWLVREGKALAYRKYSLDYVDEEADARASKRGLWAGTFIPPWDWRRRSK